MQDQNPPTSAKVLSKETLPPKTRTLSSLHVPSPNSLINTLPMPNLLNHTYMLIGEDHTMIADTGDAANTDNPSTDARREKINELNRLHKQQVSRKYSNNYNLVRDSAYENVLNDVLYNPTWTDSNKDTPERTQSIGTLSEVAKLFCEDMKSQKIRLNAHGASKMSKSGFMGKLIDQCGDSSKQASVASSESETNDSKNSSSNPQKLSPLMTQFLKLVSTNKDLQPIKERLTTTQAKPTTRHSSAKLKQAKELRKRKYGKTPVAKKRKKHVKKSSSSLSQPTGHNKENEFKQQNGSSVSQASAVPATKRLGNILHAPQASASQSTQQGQVDALEIFLQDVLSYSLVQKDRIRTHARTHQKATAHDEDAMQDEGDHAEEDKMYVDEDGSEDFTIDPYTMDRLYTELCRAKEADILKRVEKEKLKQLLFVFAELITETLDKLSSGDQNDHKDVIEEHERQVSLSLRASHIALELMTYSTSASVNNPTIFIIEEVVESIIDQLKFLIQFYIIPTVQKEYSASKKRKTFSCNHTMVKICSLLNLVFELIQQVDLKDEFLLRITHLTISSFFVEGLSKIQLASYKIINYIFSKYPEHRINCLQSIIASVLSLSKKKQVERKFKLENGASVQTFSALVVQLIQTCAGKPGQMPPGVSTTSITAASADAMNVSLGLSEGGDTPVTSEVLRSKDTSASTNSDTTNNDPFSNIPTPTTDENQLNDPSRLSDFYRLSQHCANTFLKSFLDQCASGQVGGDSRRIIEHFVDDLLVMIEMPSFPAADMILQVTCKALHEHFLVSESVAEKYKVGAIQLLGKIACTSRRIAKSRHDSSQKEATKIALEQAFATLTHESESSFYRSTASKSTWGTSTHSQLLIYNYLCSEEQPWLPYARQYSIAQWYESDSLRDQHSDYYRELFNVDFDAECKKGTSSGKTDHHDSHFSVPAQYEDIADAFHYILEKRRVSSINSFDYILKNIIKLLRDDKAKIRAAAIKAVKDIVETDYSVIESADVANAIIERQNDERISVRESLLQLIGSVLEQSSQMLKTTPIFIPMLLRGLNDKGVSVRKRCIRILGSVYNFQEISSKIKTDIATALLKRLKPAEEEAIRDLVMKSFNHMWFEDTSKKDDRVKQNALRIVSAVGEEGIANNLDIDIYWLSQLLKSNKSRKGFNKLLQEMIDSLFNVLIEEEEERNASKSEDKMSDEEKEDKPAAVPSPKPSLTAIMMTLYVFCNYNARLFKSHVMTLMTYLDQEFMTEYKDEASLFIYLFRILDRVIPIMNPPSEANRGEIFRRFQTTLFRNCTLVETAFELCVSCMMAFSTRFDHVESILKILMALYGHCYQQTSHQSARVIKILCYMCRFFDFNSVDFEEYGITQQTAQRSPLNISESILNQVYTQTLRMARSEDQLISSTSVLGLGSLLIRNPSLFVDGRFSETLAVLLASEHDMVITSVLELFEKYFESVEKMLSSASSADQQMDNSITMGIIPQYISRILQFLSNPNDTIREKALNVIDITLRQGLYIPQVCIPYVIGLEADPSESVRKHANLLNHELYERHMNELRSKASRGMILSYDLLRRKFPDGVRRFQTRTLFHRFYNLLCKYSRSSRNHVMDGFLRSVLTEEESNLDRLCYFAHVLAHLNFGNLEEVYHVITELIRHIDQCSADVSALLKELKHQESVDFTSSEITQYLQQGCSLYVVISLTSFLQGTFGAKSTLLAQYEDRHPSKTFDRPCVRYISNISLSFEHLFDLLKEPSREKFIAFYKRFKQLHEDYMHSTIDDAIFTRQVASSRRAIRGSRGPTSTKSDDSSGIPKSAVVSTNQQQEKEQQESISKNDSSTPRKIGLTPVRKRKRTSQKKSTSQSRKTPNPSRRTKRRRVGSDDDDDDYIPE